MNKNKENRKMRRKAGFTLVEMIVVITIIGILSTVLYTSYNKYIKSSKEAVCESELLEICQSLEFQMLENQNSGRVNAEDYDETNFVTYTEFFAIANDRLDGISDNDERHDIMAELFTEATGEELGRGATLDYGTTPDKFSYLSYSRNGYTIVYDPVRQYFLNSSDNLTE